jgi:hypothetical protein
VWRIRGWPGGLVGSRLASAMHLPCVTQLNSLQSCGEVFFHPYPKSVSSYLIIVHHVRGSREFSWIPPALSRPFKSRSACFPATGPSPVAAMPPGPLPAQANMTRRMNGVGGGRRGLLESRSGTTCLLRGRSLLVSGAQYISRKQTSKHHVLCK